MGLRPKEEQAEEEEESCVEREPWLFLFWLIGCDSNTKEWDIYEAKAIITSVTLDEKACNDLWMMAEDLQLVASMKMMGSHRFFFLKKNQLR